MSKVSFPQRSDLDISYATVRNSAGERRKEIAAVKGQLALYAGLTFAFLSERLAPTFSDPEAIEKYHELPVLLTIASKDE